MTDTGPTIKVIGALSSYALGSAMKKDQRRKEQQKKRVRAYERKYRKKHYR